jgi:AAA15 family ATPase/GTPase
MLLQFSANNFRSVKDTVTFSMNTATNKPSEHSFQVRNYHLLNSAVIYGANASGKSNFLEAMAFMRRFVLNKSKITQSTDELLHKPFLCNTETENASSYFEIIFLSAKLNIVTVLKQITQRFMQNGCLLMKREKNLAYLNGIFKQIYIMSIKQNLKKVLV